MSKKSISLAHSRLCVLRAGSNPTGTMPWTYLPNWHCFVKPARHASLVIAQSECRDDPNCGGVYKPHGLSKNGDSAYFLCDERLADDGTKGDQVWEKSKVTIAGMVASEGLWQLPPNRSVTSTRHLQATLCTDTPGFADAFGTCAMYEAHKWCTRSGSTGSAWQASWGALNPNATEACCACGKKTPVCVGICRNGTTDLAAKWTCRLTPVSQLGHSSRRRRNRRALGTHQRDPRMLPGKSCDVSTQELGQISTSTYQQIVACLNKPGTTMDTCRSKSSAPNANAAPTTAPTRPGDRGG